MIEVTRRTVSMEGDSVIYEDRIILVETDVDDEAFALAKDHVSGDMDYRAQYTIIRDVLQHTEPDVAENVPPVGTEVWFVSG